MTKITLDGDIMLDRQIDSYGRILGLKKYTGKKAKVIILSEEEKGKKSMVVKCKDCGAQYERELPFSISKCESCGSTDLRIQENFISCSV